MDLLCVDYLMPPPSFSLYQLLLFLFSKYRHLLLQQYQYWILLLGSVFEGDATLISASFLAHQGLLSLPLVVVTAAFSTTGANEVYYLVARRRGRIQWERKAAKQLYYRKVQAWLQRRGSLLMLFSRFIFGLRIAIPAACGASGMSPLRFFALN